MDLKLQIALALPFLLVIFSNSSGDLLGTLRNFWYTRNPNGVSPSSHGGSGDGKVTSVNLKGKKSFSQRNGFHEEDPYTMSGASSSVSQRGWGGGGWGWGDDHQNLDLYSLLGGLSFASLLGATIIYLARRNTSGRRRRSADGMSYLEEDEFDGSEEPSIKGLNIVELIDTFLDSEMLSKENGGDGGRQSRNTSKSTSKVHLGPGVVPHKIVKQ